MGWFPNYKMEVCVGWGAEDSGLTTFQGRSLQVVAELGEGLASCHLGAGWEAATQP